MHFIVDGVGIKWFVLFNNSVISKCVWIFLCWLWLSFIETCLPYVKARQGLLLHAELQPIRQYLRTSKIFCCLQSKTAVSIGFFCAFCSSSFDCELHSRLCIFYCCLTLLNYHCWLSSAGAARLNIHTFFLNADILHSHFTFLVNGKSNS